MNASALDIPGRSEAQPVLLSSQDHESTYGTGEPQGAGRGFCVGMRDVFGPAASAVPLTATPNSPPITPLAFAGDLTG